MNRRKLIGVVASVLVALGGTFVILRSSNSSKPAPVALAEPAVTVLKVVKPVPKGTAADKLGDAVQEVSVPASQRAAGAAATLADLTGLVVSTDLVPDEQVMKARFITAQEQQRTEVANTGGSGLMGVWLSLEPLRALGGRVQPGDQVAVVTSFVNVPSNGKNAEGAVPATAILLHKVPVLEVVGGILPAAPAPDGSAVTTIAPVAPLLVKLGVTAGESERLIYAMNNGALWLASEANDVPEDGTKVVTRDNVYDKTLRRYELTPLTSTPPATPTGAGAVNTDPFASTATTTPGTAGAAGAPVAGAPVAGAAGATGATGATPTTKAPVAGTAATTKAPGAVAPTTKAPAAAATIAKPAIGAPAPAATPAGANGAAVANGAGAAPATGAQQ